MVCDVGGRIRPSSTNAWAVYGETWLQTHQRQPSQTAVLQCQAKQNVVHAGTLPVLHHPFTINYQKTTTGIKQNVCDTNVSSALHLEGQASRQSKFQKCNANGSNYKLEKENLT
eukprot:4926488-Amphidinium_carterae.2